MIMIAVTIKNKSNNGDTDDGNDCNKNDILSFFCAVS